MLTALKFPAELELAEVAEAQGELARSEGELKRRKARHEDVSRLEEEQEAATRMVETQLLALCEAMPDSPAPCLMLQKRLERELLAGKRLSSERQELARAVSRMVCVRTPHRASAWFHDAKVCMMTDCGEEAAKSLATALEWAPGYGDCHVLQLLLAEGRPDMVPLVDMNSRVRSEGDGWCVRLDVEDAQKAALWRELVSGRSLTRPDGIKVTFEVHHQD